MNARVNQLGDYKGGGKSSSKRKQKSMLDNVGSSINSSTWDVIGNENSQLWVSNAGPLNHELWKRGPAICTHKPSSDFEVG